MIQLSPGSQSLDLLAASSDCIAEQGPDSVELRIVDHLNLATFSGLPRVIWVKAFAYFPAADLRLQVLFWSGENLVLTSQEMDALQHDIQQALNPVLHCPVTIVGFTSP